MDNQQTRGTAAATAAVAAAACGFTPLCAGRTVTQQPKPDTSAASIDPSFEARGESQSGRVPVTDPIENGVGRSIIAEPPSRENE